MLGMPIGIVTFTVTVAVWSIALGLICSPLAFVFGVFRLNIGPLYFDGPTAMMFATFAGVVMTVIAFGITRGLVRLEGVMASALLDASPDELRRRVSDLATSRTRSMSAADQDRRRLERDLHDGAQQRMVSLAMTLGLAKQKLATNPEQGARLVAEAHEEAKRALQDLRDLARGLHPAVLTDHGLEAALPALAARCPIPTSTNGGLTSTQTGMTSGQRGAKGQPGGARVGSGGSPGIAASRLPSALPVRETAFSRATVYGCCGCRRARIGF